jgi:HD superfamily phosphohydrolase
MRLKTVRVIKDPIHDYIAVSELENSLINDPFFLRLQNISQNGLAYLTYPSNRTSRFIHSLGTMHIGGEMIVNLLRTSERGVTKAFLGSFQAVMDDAAQDVSVRIDQIRDFVARQDDLLYLNNGFDPKAPQDLCAIILFQALRIACVMHDVGHPPFSHTVEMVLQSKLDSLQLTKPPREYKKFGQILSNLRRAEPGQLHEKIGRELTSYVFSEIGGDHGNFGKLCFWIANRIATPELAARDPKGLFACLHSLVSGQSIDADRCDYVLRDGHASGFEFGEYDLTRILHNLRMLESAAGAFEIVSTTTAGSALESFFLERYRIWRWVVFHPNVVRAEIALSRAVALLLEIAFADKADNREEKLVRQLLDSWEFRKFWRSFSSQESYREYVSCDEPWLLALLREIQLMKGMSGWLPRRVAMLRTYLDFVLDRRKSSFATFWKRAEEYEEFAKKVAAHRKDYENQLSESGLLPKNEKETEWLNRVLQTVLEKDLSSGQVECMRKLEARLQDRLKEDGLEGAMLTRVLRFSPYKECRVIDKNGKTVLLSNLSTVVENLPKAWKRDIQFRAYWIGLKRKGSRFSIDAAGPMPYYDQLAKHFLPVLLDEKEWYSLRLILRGKETSIGKTT